MADSDSSSASASSYDLRQLLGSGSRDFLINSKGDQVNIIKHLQGKTVGIYFSAHWCSPCRHFTPCLSKVYGEVNTAEDDQLFEIVFVSGDNDEESFNDYLAEMPWLAVPFSDSKTGKRLNQQFRVAGIPHLVILKAEPGSTAAEVINVDAVDVVQEHGAETFPFFEERVEKVEAAEDSEE